MASASSILLEEAAQFHERGALADAASRYRQVLGSEPQNVDALYCLAVIGVSTGTVLGRDRLAAPGAGRRPAPRACP